MEWNNDAVPELRESIKACYGKVCNQQMKAKDTSNIEKISNYTLPELCKFLNKYPAIISVACENGYHIILDFVILSPEAVLKRFQDKVLDTLWESVVSNELYLYLEKLCQDKYICRIINEPNFFRHLKPMSLEILAKYGYFDIKSNFAELFYNCTCNTAIEAAYYLVSQYPQYIQLLNLKDIFYNLDNAWCIDKYPTSQDYILIAKILETVSAYKSVDSVNKREAKFKQKLSFSWTEKKEKHLRKVLIHSISLLGLECELCIDTAPLEVIWEYITDDAKKNNWKSILCKSYELNEDIVYYFVLYYPETQGKDIPDFVYYSSMTFILTFTNAKGELALVRKGNIKYLLDRTKGAFSKYTRNFLFEALKNGAFNLFEYLITISPEYKKNTHIFTPLMGYTMHNSLNEEEFNQIIKIVKSMSEIEL